MSEGDRCLDPAESSALLKLWALEAGFDRAGVAALGPSRYGEAYLRWLELGHQASMQYLERRVECRLDPHELVPGARSVLCVALQYAPAASDVTGDLWPRVARYARGRDYHDIFVERLRGLSETIEERYPETVARWYVDTGPVLERELAERAGLGVFGKNTHLLHPESGSYFLLGEIFLHLELEVDVPLADLCGTCTACLEACPTDALVEPFVLDSNRCISYWNIEHRGPIERNARSLLGEWVFGCDICQEVCPWNVDPSPAADSELELPKERASLDLMGLLLLDREQYTERFRQSPMKRAKLEGLQRNAAVAMGNRGHPRYVEALGTALLNEAETVRGHAAWALGRIGDEQARRALSLRLPLEPSAPVRDEIRLALESSGGGPTETTIG